MIEINILRHSDDWSEKLDTRLKKAVDMTLLAFEFDETRGIEVNMVLTNDAEVQTLNREYRGKDKPTNVLSFPQDEPENPEMPYILGDVILAHETILKESEEQEKKFTDHLRHLIVHGTLHLLGYDHQTDEEAQEMESLEIEILHELNIKNPYATS